MSADSPGLMLWTPQLRLLEDDEQIWKQEPFKSAFAARVNAGTTTRSSNSSSRWDSLKLLLNTERWVSWDSADKTWALTVFRTNSPLPGSRTVLE